VHPLTKSLRLSKVVYILTEEANLLLRATVLTIDLPYVLFFIITQDEVRAVTGGGIGSGSLASTRKALKVPPTFVASNYVRNYNASGLPIKNAQIFRKDFKKKI